MDKKLLDLYTDYLLSTFGYATATGLSRMLDGDISHDQVTRFLSERTYTSKDLWLEVKPTIRKVESDEGVLLFDDTIQEKPYTDENEVMCWHYDHSQGRSVQGFNLLNCLYQVEEISIPVAFEVISKPIQYSDLKTKKRKRKSLVTKNELMREMVTVCVKKQTQISLCALRYLVCCSRKYASHQENAPKRIYMCVEKQSLGCAQRGRSSCKTFLSD